MSVYSSLAVPKMLDIKMPDFSSLFGAQSLSMPKISIPQGLNPAEWMYKRLVKSIVQFENNLDESEEVGARLVSFGSEVFHIEDLGYWGPDIIKLYGTNQNGKAIELIQHMSQLSMLLVAVAQNC